MATGTIETAGSDIYSDSEEYVAPTNRHLGRRLLQEALLKNATFYLLIPLSVLAILRLIEWILYAPHVPMFLLIWINCIAFSIAYFVGQTNRVNIKNRLNMFLLCLYVVLALEFIMTWASSSNQILTPSLIQYVLWTIHFNSHRNILYIGFTLISIFGYLVVLSAQKKVFCFFVLDIVSYVTIFNLFYKNAFAVYFWRHFYSTATLDQTVDKYWAIHELVETSLTNLLPIRWRERVIKGGLGNAIVEDFEKLVVVSFLVKTVGEGEFFDFTLLDEIFESLDATLDNYPVEKIQTQKNIYTSIVIPHKATARFLRSSITHACDYAFHSMLAVREDYPDIQITCGISCGPSYVAVLDRSRPTICIDGEAFRTSLVSVLSCPFFKVQADKIVATVISSSSVTSRYKVDMSSPRREKRFSHPVDVNTSLIPKVKFAILDLKINEDNRSNEPISSLYLPGTVLLKKGFKFPPDDGRNEREELVRLLNSDEFSEIEEKILHSTGSVEGSGSVEEANTRSFFALAREDLSVTKKRIREYERLFPVMLFISIIDSFGISVFHGVHLEQGIFGTIPFITIPAELIIISMYWDRFRRALKLFEGNQSDPPTPVDGEGGDGELKDSRRVISIYEPIVVRLQKHWMLIVLIKVGLLILNIGLQTKCKSDRQICFKVITMCLLRLLFVNNFLMIEVLRLRDQTTLNAIIASAFLFNVFISLERTTEVFSIYNFYRILLNHNFVSMFFSIILVTLSGGLYRSVLAKIHVMTNRTIRMTESMGESVAKEDKTLEFLKGCVIPRFLSRRLEEMYVDRVTVSLENAFVIVAEIYGTDRCAKTCGNAAVVSLMNDIFGHFDELNNEYSFSKCRVLLNRYSILCHEETQPKSENISFFTKSLISILSIHLNKEQHLALKEFLSLRVGVGYGSLSCGIMGPSLRVTVELQGEAYYDAIDCVHTCNPNSANFSEKAKRKLGMESGSS